MSSFQFLIKTTFQLKKKKKNTGSGSMSWFQSENKNIEPIVCIRSWDGDAGSELRGAEGALPWSIASQEHATKREEEEAAAQFQRKTAAAEADGAQTRSGCLGGQSDWE